MMTKGTVGAELELTFSFHPDGALSAFAGASLEGSELPPDLARRLWAFLRDLKAADVLVDIAAENADAEADDAACDESREAEGAA